MKHKILVSGDNPRLITEFFFQSDAMFECMSTSENWEDFVLHMRYFQPDAFIRFMGGNANDELRRVNSIVNDSRYSELLITLVGEEDVCQQARALGGDYSGLILERPISPRDIKDIVSATLRKNKEKKRREEEERLQKEVAIEKRKKERDEKKRQEKENERKKILIVDDDRGVLRLLKTCLGANYDVSTVVDGKMCLKYFEHHTADLIFLDYEMPDETGASVFKKLRLRRTSKNVPIIFLTGVADRSKIAEVLSLNPQGYLLKPINMGRLREAISEVFGNEIEEE